MSKRKNDNDKFKERMNKIFHNGVKVNDEFHKFETRQDFADFLEVSRPALTSWLNTNRSPDMDMLVQISKKLNMSIDYLVGLTDANTYDADIQAVTRYTGLEEDTIKALRDERFRGEMASFLNGFVKHDKYNRFAVSFARAVDVSHTHYTDDRLFMDDGDGVPVLSMTSQEIVMHYCTAMSHSLEDYAEYYFNLDMKALAKFIINTNENGEELFHGEV